MKYSKMAMSLVLGSTLMMAADTTTLEEVFTQGELQSTLGWFWQHIDAKEGIPNNGFSNGFLNVGFQTASFHGVSLGISGWGSVKTSEKNDDDYKSTIEDQSVLSQAYIKIEHVGMDKVVVGRQAVDFNWLTDYIDGVTAEISAVENLVLSFTWALKYAVIDVDEISEEFSKINKNKGIYMLDAKYTPIEAFELNPYLYYGDNLLSAYGLKAILILTPSDEIKTTTMAHYVAINSDIVDTKDGSFAQIEQGIEFLGANVAIGYINVDKEGMAGLGEFGDQLPFEEGNHVLDADARTPYVLAAYDIQNVKLAALYGQTKYQDTTFGTTVKEKELNLSASYEIVKNLEASVIYANVDNDNNVESYNVIKAHIAYQF